MGHTHGDTNLSAWLDGAPTRLQQPAQDRGSNEIESQDDSYPNLPPTSASTCTAANLRNRRLREGKLTSGLPRGQERRESLDAGLGALPRPYLDQPYRHWRWSLALQLPWR